MSAKNRGKIQPLGPFFRLALEIFLLFCVVRSKNQNKSRLSRNATKLYRHLYKNKYRGCEKFRNVLNKSQFFNFFNCDFARFGRENY